HRKSRGHVASQFHESSQIEILWTIIPTLILVGMAIPATKTMMELNDVQDADMSIKVTGWQWKWEYEYLDTGVHFFSSLDEASNRARQLGSGIDPRSVPHYLLNVDNPLVIPVKKKIRFLFTAADVLHSWWVPDLGWKKDTIPGFINEAWTYVEKPGTYRGQCTELCGKDHGFMPIVVIAMEQVDYDNWVAEQKGLVAETNAAAEKEWSKDELIAKGESVYQNNCASCHMADGAGMAGAFPALSGSKLVNGDINSQIDLVYKGKGMMPAFGQMLSEVDFAAVITYTRNALGNAVGDSVQPSAIKSLKSSAPAQNDDKDEDDKDEGNT
ncbi:MAG: cytochrome c oxidase subunit II, partial [Methylicorpusculum sp.]|nr:cytochrome c oxidase subunit II [Methylicorpusculum sp.]